MCQHGLTPPSTRQGSVTHLSILYKCSHGKTSTTLAHHLEQRCILHASQIPRVSPPIRHLRVARTQRKLCAAQPSRHDATSPCFHGDPRSPAFLAVARESRISVFSISATDPTHGKYVASCSTGSSTLPHLTEHRNGSEWIKRVVNSPGRPASARRTCQAHSNPQNQPANLHGFGPRAAFITRAYQEGHPCDQTPTITRSWPAYRHASTPP